MIWQQGNDVLAKHERQAELWGHNMADEREIYTSLPDQADVRELIEFFVDELSHHLKSMQQALDEADWRTLDLHAHQLKGAGGGFGFDIVTAYAGKLEQLIRSTVMDEDEVRLAAQELIDICKRIKVRTT